MDITIHNVTDISVETRRRDGTTWADIKIKWAGFGEKGEQSFTLFFRDGAADIAAKLAAAFPQMEEA